MLQNRIVELRELELIDAPSLLAHLRSPSVVRYLAPPPSTIQGLERFIRRTHTARRRGTYLCLGIVPPGEATAVGLVQIWPIEPDGSTAEWGFVIGESFWGRGLFEASAELLLDFAFDRLRVKRLETRTVEANGRSSGALQKLGAIREGTLRSAFQSGDTRLDHVMWSILAEEWRARRLRPAEVA